MKILVINGPNLNMLGIREPDVYGTLTLSDVEKNVAEYAKVKNIETEFFQSNSEGDIIDALHNTTADGIILNAGAYTHYAYAIADAVKSISSPVVEVHLSNVFSREDFRHKSVLLGAVKGSICGFSVYGYCMAVDALINIFDNANN